MSDTEIRMMRYTIEQLSAELQATRQYVSDIKSKLERTRKALDVAKDALKYLYDTNDDYVPGFAVPCGVKGYAKEKLEQIKTALEQKDK